MLVPRRNKPVAKIRLRCFLTRPLILAAALWERRLMRLGGRAYKLEDVERIGAMGLAFAEINLLQGDELIYRPRELLAVAGRWNLRYLVHAHNEGDPRDVRRLEEAFFAEILRLLELSAEISATLLTVHFWMDQRFIPLEILERKRPILCDMARAGSRKGIQVCLENLSERAEDLRPVLEGCPELGLTLDIGHGQLFTRTNRALDILDRWPRRILHVHAHDNRGGNKVGDDLHLPIGEGIIDFSTVAGALRKAGYDGGITLEVPVDQLESSARRLQRMMESREREETA
jgi:sugar phosphate isomerase/epimerase